MSNDEYVQKNPTFLFRGLLCQKSTLRRNSDMTRYGYFIAGMARKVTWWSILFWNREVSYCKVMKGSAGNNFLGRPSSMALNWLNLFNWFIHILTRTLLSFCLAYLATASDVGIWIQCLFSLMRIQTSIRRIEMDSDSPGFGFEVSGFGSQFGSQFGFEMSGFAHHWPLAGGGVRN